MKTLVAIPVYNEVRHVEHVLGEVRRYSSDILVVDDGSTDGTSELLRRHGDIRLVRHPANQGYGAAIRTAFDYAIAHDYEFLLTMDCDGQHEPARIPVLLEAADDRDIVSGSRYLRDFRQDGQAPQDRRAINRVITQEINDRFGLDITDAFCGFKLYRVEALKSLRPTETGWGMPLQLWVQAAKLGLRVHEIGVPRLYLDPNRSFGAGLDDAERRLAYYRTVIEAAERDFAPIGSEWCFRGSRPVIRSTRYRAPTADATRLVEPGFAVARHEAEANARLLDSSEVRIDGLPLAEFRRLARAEVLALSREYHHSLGETLPANEDGGLTLSGHQPEPFHPGVWVKNFALAGLAHATGRTALNLIVDNDTAKSTSLRLPVIAPDPAKVHLEAIAYDRFDGEVPYEERRVLDPDLFRSFGERARQVTRHWPYEPLLNQAWREAVARMERGETLGTLTAATRRCWERRWGCHNLEVPLSKVCDGEMFRRFVRHLLADLPRFHALYNQIVLDYRREHKIRSRNHPVPELATVGDNLEAPFWSWLPGQTRRGRLMVPPSFDLNTHLRRGHKLRSRALTTTLFARLALGDLFLHGIGGGKYDELTDELIRRWLGMEPPSFVVMSASLWLPLPDFPVTRDDLAERRRAVREAYWHPEGYPAFVGREGKRATLLARKKELLERKPVTAGERGMRLTALRHLHAAMAPLTDGPVTPDRATEQQVHANRLLHRRDYSWMLYPEERLRPFLQETMRLAAGA